MAGNPSGLGSARRCSDIMRIMEQLIIQENGCCTWPGKLNNGYAQVHWRRHTRSVHRLIYEYFVGPIPEGMQLDHLCRNRACANFAHLEPVTPQENVRRGISLAARYGARTHCDKGHPLSGENLRERMHGGRHRRDCLICATEADRKAKAKRRAARAAALGPAFKPAPPPWSADDDRALRRLFFAGQTDGEIAAALKRTEWAIKTRRSDLKLYQAEQRAAEGLGRANERRVWSVEADRELREKFGEGRTDEEIGVALERTAGAVLMRRCELKLHRCPQRAPKGTVRLPRQGEAAGNQEAA